MIWVYIASAIFGSAFTIPMMLGGLDLGDDVDLDFDADTDFDIDTDFDVDAGVEVESPTGDLGNLGAAGDPGFVHSVGDFVSSLLNFRSIVFAFAFLGWAGIVFTALGFNSVVVLLTAIALALFAASVNASIMRFITGDEASSILTSRDVQGTQAEVVLPIAADRKGRIRAQIAGQTEYFVALPFGNKQDHDFAVGDAVVVVEIDNGTAMVSPLPRLES